MVLAVRRLSGSRSAEVVVTHQPQTAADQQAHLHTPPKVVYANTNTLAGKLNGSVFVRHLIKTPNTYTVYNCVREKVRSRSRR